MEKTYAVSAKAVKYLMLERWGEVEQKHLIEETGLSKGTIVRILQGKSFNSDSLYQLCSALRCTPDQILIEVPKDDTDKEIAN